MNFLRPRVKFHRQDSGSPAPRAGDEENQLGALAESIRDSEESGPSTGTACCTSATDSAPATRNTTTLPSPVTSNEKDGHIHFAEAQPPAYDSVFGKTGSRRNSRSAADGEEPTTIEIPIANGSQQPTVLVLFKEDYKWARAYLKDMDYRVALRRALRRHLYKWYFLLAVIITISVLVSAKHTSIVNFCRPVTEKIRSWPAGWMIPIVLLVIVSFPPLVGHEIIGILCGLVWGIWEGFGILCAGTFIGELATWVVFKWMCTARAKKFEKKNQLFSSLTTLLREKSFTFVLILRFSAIPGHIVTAVSASAGAKLSSYCAAAFLTLPKQFTITYLGSSFGSKKKSDTYISAATTAATFIGTIIAAAYIYYQMRVVIRRGGASRFQAADPHRPASPTWQDVEVRGAKGVGAAARFDLDDGGPRRSVDIVFGPHARRPWMEAQRQRQQRRRANTLQRTRSLPGPITEEEMRDWLSGLDTALMTTAGTPHVRVLSPPVHHEDANANAGVNDKVTTELLRTAGPARSRANTGELEPIPYAQSVLLSPPATASRADSPSIPALILPSLAMENMYQHPDESLADIQRAADGPDTDGRTLRPAGLAERPMSGTVPAIALTPTYTPARSRADTLRRGTVSLDIERPRMGGREIADEADLYAYDHGARRPDSARLRGESHAGLLGRPDWLDSQSGPNAEVNAGNVDVEQGQALGDVPEIATTKAPWYRRLRGSSVASALGRPILSRGNSQELVEVKAKENQVAPVAESEAETKESKEAKEVKDGAAGEASARSSSSGEDSRK